jgi:hypothetical protein
MFSLRVSQSGWSINPPHFPLSETAKFQDYASHIGSDEPQIERTPFSTLVKALARAFRWKRMLDSGDFATIAELAEREGIASSYMTRVLRLTLLAPDIVEAILDGKQGPEVSLVCVLEPFPLTWEQQTSALGLENK